MGLGASGKVYTIRCTAEPWHEADAIDTLRVAFNQPTFAFGPGVLGLIRDMTGSYTASLVPLMTSHLSASSHG